MKLAEAQQIWENSGLIKNFHYFNRYIKLINHFNNKVKEKDITKKGEYEFHHILTVKIFPEFAKEKWNLILLPSKAHYVAHYLLFKSIHHTSCVYAFNQMRRISKHLGRPKCRLYAEVKREFAKIISANNTGRSMSDKCRSEMSTRTRGTNVYRNNTTGELCRFKVGSQPADWEPFQTGRKRSVESRNKLGNSIRGRILQYNPDTKDVKSVYKLLPGYIKGVPPWFDNNASKLKNYTWLYHEKTGEALRIDITNGIPDGYKIGRFYNNEGFRKINNEKMQRMLDLKEKKYCIVDKALLPNNRYILHGSSVDKVQLLMYNNRMYPSYSAFLSAHPEFPVYKGSRDSSILTFIVPAPHHNQTKSRQEFCEKHQGKTFQELGMYLIPLNDYIFKENE